MSEHRSHGCVPLISHPYDDSSACLLRHCDPYDLLLLNLSHMTTCRRCRQHLVLTPPHSIPHSIFLTLFYPLHSSLYSSLYPLPRQQHTYHRGRPSRLGRQQPLYRKTDRFFIEAVTQIVSQSINSLLIRCTAP